MKESDIQQHITSAGDPVAREYWESWHERLYGTSTVDQTGGDQYPVSDGGTHTQGLGDLSVQQGKVGVSDWTGSDGSVDLFVAESSD